MSGGLRSATLSVASFMVATGLLAVITATLIGVALTARHIVPDEDSIT